MPPPPRLFAYIDETGDRGARPESSPIFGMACVLVDDVGATNVQTAVTTLRQDFRVPQGVVLSWKDHAKTHERRRRASEVLGDVGGIRVIYVYARKAELRAGTYLDDPTRFYNYVAGKMYTSLLWAARSWKGPRARVWTRFGHVRGHDHRTTEAYLTGPLSRDARIPMDMEQGLRWVSADQYVESQAADLFGGFLQAALWPHGAFNYTEPSYLQRVWPLIHRVDGCANPLGIMSMPRNEILTEESWFPCANCQKKSVP